MKQQCDAIRKIVEILNAMYAADPVAMESLVKHRVPCNSDLADIAFVGSIDGVGYHTGLVGILNGLFASPDKPAVIAAAMSYEGELVRFVAIEPVLEKVTT